MNQQIKNTLILLPAVLFLNGCAPLIDYFVVEKNIKRREARNV